VVAIIALLISILLPSLNRAREQTRNAVCAVNLRSMGQGIAMYSNDNAGVLPGPLHPPIYRQAGEIQDQIEDDLEFDELAPETFKPWYLLSRLADVMAGGNDPYHELVDRVATCPTHSNKNPDENFYPGNVNPQTPPIADDNASATNFSLSRPYHYLPNIGGNTDPGFYFGLVNVGVTWEGAMVQLNANPELKPEQLERVRRPSDEWAIGDAWTTTLPGGRGSSGARAGTWQIPNDRASQGSHNPLPTRPVHNNWRGTNLLYFDGHASMHMLPGTEKTTDVPHWVLQFPGNPDDDMRETRDQWFQRLQ
jgi:prepilin-type processing-associated H-X9-DG protein